MKAVVLMALALLVACVPVPEEDVGVAEKKISEEPELPGTIVDEEASQPAPKIILPKQSNQSQNATTAQQNTTQNTTRTNSTGTQSAQQPKQYFTTEPISIAEGETKRVIVK